MAAAAESSNNTFTSSGVSRKRSFKKSISNTIKKVTNKQPHYDDTSTTNNTTKSNNNEAMFRYGNYNRYYGYRNENNEDDKRFAVLQRDWFEGKSVLDIGSNVGHVSLWIGKNFLPARVKGVDIDVALVKAAKNNIVHYIDENYVSSLEHSFNNQEPKSQTTTSETGCDVVSEKLSFAKKQRIDIGSISDETLTTYSSISSKSESTTSGTNSLCNSSTDDNVFSCSTITNNRSGEADKVRGTNTMLPLCEKSDELIMNKTAVYEENAGVGENGNNSVKEAIAVGTKTCTEEGKELIARVERSKCTAVDQLFPYNISFVLENYVPPAPQVLQYAKAEYDIVLCLSVTKWVQLNFGDAGLKMMFQKIFKQLHPGGRFILEPQPFNSYKRRKNLTAAIRRNYDAMELMPEQFPEYLLSSEVGFSTCEKIADDLHEKQGFKRPIYLLTKQ